MTDTADTEAPGEAESPAPAPKPLLGRRVSVLTLWLSEASKDRVTSTFECELTESVEKAAVVDLVAISTRTPKARVNRIMERVIEEADCPVAVICHAGGEAAAVELVERGATCVVAEGNEAALHRLVPDAATVVPDYDDNEFEDELDDTPTEVLVTTFAQRLDQQGAGPVRQRGRDEVTGLLGSSAFELRFAELSQRGTLPRLGFLRLSNPDDTIADLDRETVDLLRRRLAMLFQSIANRFEAELFSLDDVEYAFLSRRLSDKRAGELGEALVEVGTTFSPTGAEPMRLAVGHAGAEVAAEPRTLRELAQRAVEAAASGGGGVVSADELSRSQASSTELQAALRLAERVDELSPYPVPHSGRVADYAVEIARELGLDGHELVRLRLAGLLHDIGKLGLPEATWVREDEIPPDAMDAWREHPERSARYASLSAGSEVALAVRHHHEHWDGSGFPDGLLEEDIPLSARILAVADAYDRFTCDADGLSLTEIVARFEAESGRRFDPTVVKAALELFGS